MNVNQDLIAHYTVKKDELSTRYNSLMQQLKMEEEDFNKKRNSAVAELNMLLGSYKEIEMLLLKLLEKEEGSIDNVALEIPKEVENKE